MHYKEIGRMADQAKAEGDFGLAKVLFALAAARAADEEDQLFIFLERFVDGLKVVVEKKIERANKLLGYSDDYQEWLKRG